MRELTVPTPQRVVRDSSTSNADAPGAPASQLDLCLHQVRLGAVWRALQRAFTVAACSLCATPQVNCAMQLRDLLKQRLAYFAAGSGRHGHRVLSSAVSDHTRDASSDNSQGAVASSASSIKPGAASTGAGAGAGAGGVTRTSTTSTILPPPLSCHTPGMQRPQPGRVGRCANATLGAVENLVCRVLSAMIAVLALQVRAGVGGCGEILVCDAIHHSRTCAAVPTPTCSLPVPCLGASVWRPAPAGAAVGAAPAGLQVEDSAQLARSTACPSASRVAAAVRAGGYVNARHLCGRAWSL